MFLEQKASTQLSSLSSHFILLISQSKTVESKDDSMYICYQVLKCICLNWMFKEHNKHVAAFKAVHYLYVDTSIYQW